MKKWIKYFIYILPVTLYFSYYPLIHFGASESMNFEISLPIIWLLLFDILAFIILIRQKKLLRGLKGKWMWLLFPIFMTISILWSLNSLRGSLTVGILWLIYFAVYAMFELKGLFDKDFQKTFLKWFFGATIVICVWCFIQCLLDIFGVSREYSLLCEGCTYSRFGFPHPNGFSIEPQFMGNLLIAPAMMICWILLRKQNSKNLERKSSRGDNFYNGTVGAHTKLQFRDSLRDRCKNYSGSDFLDSKFLPFCLLLISSTLFLTFSRGAIYAFIVGMIFMSVFLLVRERREILKRVGLVWGLILFSFLFTLNIQGLMAEIGPTNDTYKIGVSKVLNHLSLGIIDIREEVVENPVENFEEGGKEEAIFDGYVKESTDVRLSLNDNAMKVWSKDFMTMMFGVGLGGAGQALYVNGMSDSPKEIIQNQYVSLLLEVGAIGFLLFILTLGLIIKDVLKKNNVSMILSLMLAFGISLLFFAGLPNALQIYLLVAILVFL